MCLAPVQGLRGCGGEFEVPEMVTGSNWRQRLSGERNLGISEIFGITWSTVLGQWGWKC